MPNHSLEKVVPDATGMHRGGREASTGHTLHVCSLNANTFFLCVWMVHCAFLPDLGHLPCQI